MRARDRLRAAPTAADENAIAQPDVDARRLKLVGRPAHPSRTGDPYVVPVAMTSPALTRAPAGTRSLTPSGSAWAADCSAQRQLTRTSLRSAASRAPSATGRAWAGARRRAAVSRAA